MIQTDEGVKIEFVKLDEWVVQLNVSMKVRGSWRILITPTFTLSQLFDEIRDMGFLEAKKPRKGGD